MMRICERCWSNTQQPPAPTRLCIVPWIPTGSLVVLFWPTPVCANGSCSSRKQAESGLCILASWTRGSSRRGWKSTWQCLLTPTSCRRHPPLADSESPAAGLPSPAAHPPVRPAALLRCWLPLLAPTRVLKVEATLMRKHSVCSSISSSASKVRPAAASPAGPAWLHSPAGQASDAEGSHHCVLESSQELGNHLSSRLDP